MNIKKLDNLMETMVSEADNDSLIKIYFSDLDLDGRTKVLEAIDNTSDLFDVFSDERVRDKLEEELSTKPLIMVDANELMSKLNIDL